MTEHYFVIADHGHLRVFRETQAPGQREPNLAAVESMDFPAGVTSYTARDTSAAGRFGGSKAQGAASGAPTARTGMSIDERLPMQREEEKRRARDVAAEIETFFAARPNATWDLAAAPALHNVVLDQLSPRVRQQLQHSVAKDLVNQRAEDIRAHFLAVSRH